MEDPRANGPGIRAQSPADELIAALAERQHGVVSREQLMAHGITRRAIGHRLEHRRLHVIHSGVYAVGHPLLTRQGRWMAAVLATKGTLSHRSAGAALGILGSSVLEVTVPERRRRPGIRIHRSPLPEDEVTRLDGIPATTAARTIFDLAGVLPQTDVERVLNEAEVQRIGGGPSVPVLLRRYPRRHGSKMLRAILSSRRGATRSELEAKFSELAGLAGLPSAERNVRIETQGHWYECDCVWRKQKLIVELDSRAYHLNIAAFEKDRTRDRQLQVSGWNVIRVTWRQLDEDLPAVASDIADLLDR